MRNEVVSIVMPAYNAEKYIKESINSVMAQDFQNWRLYIVDDASSDNTVDIINGFCDKRITLIYNEKNLGVARSRNRALNMCAGKYITFLDSDDIWCKDKLSKQLEILEQGWAVVCANYTTFRNENEIIRMRCSPEIITYSMMLKSNFIGNLTGIYNKEVLGVVYQEPYGHEDYIMWLKILSVTKKAYCIQQPLAKYRLSAASLSSNKLNAILWQWNIYRKHLRLSSVKSAYFFLFYLFYSIKKRV
ncbi:glycosyltransferase family 2 protein [Citrobacter freundii]|uniref:glycosyltransferase family 2 protein n=1 Tax=Citrobacter freundii TaxID=546 RepID=UPI0035A96A0C